MIAVDNSFSVFTKIYMPWYLPEAQYTLQDVTALNGSFYLDCDVNKFFNIMTALISLEGISELGSRSLITYFFEYKTFKNTLSDPQSTSFAVGTAFGALLGNVVDYHI